MQLMEKGGMDWATTFNNTSFTACDRNFSFHPCKFDPTRSLIVEKALDLSLPIIRGNPIYFSACLIAEAT